MRSGEDREQFEMRAVASLYGAVLNGEGQRASVWMRRALAAGIEPAMLVEEGLVAAVQEVARRYQRRTCFLPEVLRSARVVEQSLELMAPMIIEREGKEMPRAVVATVRGDRHGLGKRVLAFFLTGAGCVVTDLGVNCTPAVIVAAVQAQRAQLVGLSCSLVTSLPAVAKTMTALEDAGLRRQIGVLVGGGAVTAEFAARIGADGYAADAASAVAVAQEVLQRIPGRALWKEERREIEQELER